MPLARLAQQPLAFCAHSALLDMAPATVLVGGAVRDLLLDIPLHDLDYATSGDALAVARRLADHLGGAFYPLDAERGTGRVILSAGETEQRLVIDLVTLGEGGLDADLRARDFTTNAIAMLPDGQIYDPLGGANDLHEKRLRPCTPASLTDDPVRVLRAVRFQFTFDLQPVSGMDAQARMAAARLSEVSVERRRDEFLKLLALPTPAQAVRQLDHWQALPLLLPEALALQGIKQPPPHVYDVYEHTLAALTTMARIDLVLRQRTMAANAFEQALIDALAPLQTELQTYLEQPLSLEHPRWRWLRFAALAHDWGKPATATVAADSIHFYGHETISADLAAAWLRRYHCAAAEIAFVQCVCRGHMRPVNLGNAPHPPSRRSLYRFYRALDDCAAAVGLLHLADHAATYGPQLSHSLTASNLALVRTLLAPAFDAASPPILPEPLLNGRELMAEFGLTPGPQIGQLLESLREAQATGQVDSRPQALAYIGQLLRTPG